ncbi:MAG: DUF1549 domain-containing protein, partial [Maioricimonas sp. JB049]
MPPILGPALMFAVLLAGFCGAVSRRATADDSAVRFEKDIAPILETHCLRCHTEANAKGDLSLATFEGLREAEYVVPGHPDESYLLDLVTTAEGKQRPAMPKDGDPLSEEQVALLREWIASGATWSDGIVQREPSRADSTWWSLQPLAEVRPQVIDDAQLSRLRQQSPKGIDWDAWTSGAIDRFILKGLVENGLSPTPPASRSALIRRLTYDLTGLPPTPEEVEQFVQDDHPGAYERLVDRLLDSPHYGEQWGRHWLDVVRFGESNGFERNVLINNLWPFRDYVIRSFNEDKPFRQLVLEHLAGDVIGGGDPDVAVGTAFLVCGPYDNVGNQDAAQAAVIRANTIDEMIRATGEAFLGLTIGCARCHDHKFDPILQEDY